MVGPWPRWQPRAIIGSPPRWRSFKLSKDLAFVEKLRDIVGFTCHRRADAVVLSR